MVRTISLNDGKAIPAAVFGTGSLRENVDPILAALKAGIRGLDTSQHYGTEPEVAKAIKLSGLNREQVWVTTKISPSSNTKTDLNDIRRSTKESLDKLGFIPDMLMIHTPTLVKDGKFGEFWQHMETLVEEGTLKGASLGLSNFLPQDLEAILKVCKIKPAVHQIEFHPYVLEHLDTVLKIHEKHGIVTQAFGPLSILTNHPTGGPVKPILTKIAERLSQETGRTVDEASVMYLWVLGKGASLVTQTKNPERVKNIAQVENLRDLSKSEMGEIEHEGRKIHWRKYAQMSDMPAPDLPQDI